MEYKNTRDYYDTEEPKYFFVRQEVITVIEYNVEAESMIDAIAYVARGKTDCIVDEQEVGEEHNKKGRIISVTVNDNA